jgi:micrococcal nuclease
MSRFASLLVWVVLLGPSLGLAEVNRVNGTVVRVVDGDTIHVRIGDRIEKVRYIGMDAPEVHHPTKGEQPGGRAATEANRRLVEHQGVRLELDVQERDQYGRLLAYVYVGDVMVNAELVAQGYAQIMTIPPNVKYQDLFFRHQREARLLKLGLWADTFASTNIEPSAPSGARTDAVQNRTGVPRQDTWTCPITSPIKGNFTTYSGERCIYHSPGGEFYTKTKPERCYVTAEEARLDGCRRSRR